MIGGAAHPVKGRADARCHPRHGCRCILAPDPAEFLAARRLCYEMAGWDPDTGRPSTGKLAELGVARALAGPAKG